MAPDLKCKRTIGRAQREGAASLITSSSPLLDARILLKKVMGCDDAGLIAQSDTPLTDREAKKYDALLARRARGEPIAYITGKKEFWSLTFKVTPDVLIPRDDSECLIDTILARRPREAALTILDLGVGSGCLLCALLSEYPKSFGVGIDRSESALKVARANAVTLGFGGRSVFARGDWLAPIGGAFDIIIANPPYIADDQRSTLPEDISNFEPTQALFAGIDGMDHYRAILQGLAASPGILRNDGLIVFEAGIGQVGLLGKMVKEVLQPVHSAVISDLKGCDRGVCADNRLSEKRD